MKDTHIPLICFLDSLQWRLFSGVNSLFHSQLVWLASLTELLKEPAFDFVGFLCSFSAPLISPPGFPISMLSLTLSFICSFPLVSSGGSWGHWFRVFIFFQHRCSPSMHCTALAPGFDILYFHFHSIQNILIFILTSSLTQGWLRGMFYSFSRYLSVIDF